HHLLLGHVLLDQGDVGAALQRYRTARRLARRAGDPCQEGWAVLSQAMAQLRAPRLRAARVLQAGARALLTQPHLGPGRVLSRECREQLAILDGLLSAHIHLALGAPASAQQAAEDARRLAAAAPWPWAEALACRLVGQSSLGT